MSHRSIPFLSMANGQSSHPSARRGTTSSARRSAPCVVPRVPRSYSDSVVTMTRTRRGGLSASPPSLNASAGARVASERTCSRSCRWSAAAAEASDKRRRSQRSGRGSPASSCLCAGGARSVDISAMAANTNGPARQRCERLNIVVVRLDEALVIQPHLKQGPAYPARSPALLFWTVV